MKKIIFLLLIPIFVWAQGEYAPKLLIPFMRDTLKQADTVSGGWCFIGDKVGALTLGLIFDTDSGIDSVVNLTLQARVAMDDFLATGGVLDDSITVGTGGWMTLATVDSACITDSAAWYLDLSNENWWSWFDEIKFRLISPATNDTCIILKGILKGQ